MSARAQQQAKYWPTAKADAALGKGPTVHHVEMFTDSDFLKPGIDWGYQCFTCRHEEAGFATLPLAEAAAVQHQVEAAAS